MLRGVVVASAATAVALLGHLLASGPAPGWLGLLLPWWLSITLCTALAGRTVSLPRLSVGVGLSQAVFHALFVLGSPAGMLRAPTPGSGHGHHHLDPLAAAASGTPGAGPAGGSAAGETTAAVTGASPGSVALPHADLHTVGAHLGSAEHLAHSTHLTPAMLLGHLVAAVLTIALLHRAESGLWRAMTIGAAGRRAGVLSGRLLARTALALLSPLLASPAQQLLAAAFRCERSPTAVGPLPSCVDTVLACPDVGRAPPVVLVA